MNINTIRVALASLLLCLSTGSARAEWDPLGLRKAAEDAGRKAAIEFARGADLATRNLAMMTNQFGQLINDFYGNDQAKSNNARKILEGVFGKSLTKEDNVKLQVTAAFDGNVAPADRLEVDLWLFPNVDHDSLKTIATTGASFLPTPIKATVPEGTTLQTIRANILSKAKAYGVRVAGTKECNAKFPQPYAGGRVFPALQPRQAAAQRQFEACMAEKEALDLTEVVMAAFSAADALTTQGTVTRDLPGGRFVAVIANQQSINVLKDRLKITFWVHQAGDSSKRIGAFREVVRTIEPTDMLKNCVKTPLNATPDLCYAFVDLKLDAIMGAAYLTPAGK